MNDIVKINDTDLQVIDYCGKRVVTLAQVDAVHERPEGTAGRNFREHRARFMEGVDFFEVTADEIRRQSLSAIFPARTPKGILITESGYTMLVKPFNDDLAWDVQRKLVARYFATPQQQELSRVEILQIAMQAEQERLVLEHKVTELAPKAEALDRISAGDEALTITQAAKVLGIKVEALTTWLHANGWIYRQNESWVAYDQHIKNGRLKYKEARYTDEKTLQKVIRPYCHILPKGLTHLAQQFSLVPA